jgi:hypothetical protein
VRYIASVSLRCRIGEEEHIRALHAVSLPPTSVVTRVGSGRRYPLRAIIHATPLAVGCSIRLEDHCERNASLREISAARHMLLLRSIALLLGLSAILVLGLPVTLTVRTPRGSVDSLLNTSTTLAAVTRPEAMEIAVAAWLLRAMARERQWQRRTLTLILGPLGSSLYVCRVARLPQPVVTQTRRVTELS